MAAAEDPHPAGVGTQMRDGDAIRRLAGRDQACVLVEEAEEGVRAVAVARAEGAEEGWIADEAAPVLADEGDAVEAGRVRRETEEDLPDDVVKKELRCLRWRWRRRPAGHLYCSWARSQRRSVHKNRSAAGLRGVAGMRPD